VSKRSAPKRSNKQRAVESPRDQRAEAVTVAWMLTMMATAGADVLGAIAAVLLMPMAARADDPRFAPLLPYVLLMIAVVSGLVCLLLTPLVYRFRADPPPRAITTFGLIVSLAPILLVLWLAWLSISR
jgi:hypothetical protein